MTIRFRKIIAAIALAGYLFLAIVSVVGLSSHHMHTGAGTQDCPFALGLHSLCSMDALGHIEAWERTLFSIVPHIALAAFLFVSFFLLKPTERGWPLYVRRRPIRQYSPYVHLFARGILNPKIP